MRTIDTGTPQLLASVSTEGVATLTMNRPASKNAMTREMNEALGRVLAEVEVADDVGCVVLTGAGGAFCSGGDVKEMVAQNNGPREGTVPDKLRRGGGYDSFVHAQRLNQRAISERLHSMPKPTVAAITGAAAGGGLSVALACDLRYAVRTAVLTTAFARVGLAGDYGGTWFLSRLVGAAKARELYLFGERLGAEEALALHLVNDVFDAETFDAAVTERAVRLATGPRVAYAYMKENLNRAIHGELGECLDMEAAHHIRTGRTADHREAARAFVEKREPRFVGR
ncbi:MAG: enoyl-CoA hydratase [Desertimonas sp.]